MPGLLQRLFGPPRTPTRDYRRGPKLAGLDPVAERGVALQKQYWSAAPDELAALAAREPELTPAERLRLHHLRCIALLDAHDGLLRRSLLAPESERPSPEQCTGRTTALLSALERSAQALLGRRSEFRPRHGFVWLGAGPPEGEAIPYSDLQGRTLNPSLTHLGSLEVIALDANFEPERLEFIAFDEIMTISIAGGELGPRAPFRPARILREYGLDNRVVLIPTRYGLSWLAHAPELLQGTATREVAQIELRGLADPSKAIGQALDRRALGIAVGPQRLEVLDDASDASQAGALTSIPLGEAYQISLAIDQDDPRFADKCRGRELDPEATRGDVVRESRLRASAKAAKQRSSKLELS